jgi:gamma-glutamylcysteine synthetase
MSSIRCIKFNNVKDQIGRILAYYQSQNKYCRRLHEFISTKEPNFIQFGLKRTPITIYLESSTISRT